MPPDPTQMVSKVTSVASAQEGAPCPHFTKFLDQVTLGDAGVKLGSSAAIRRLLPNRRHE